MAACSIIQEAESPPSCRQQEVDWVSQWYPEHRKPQSLPQRWHTSSKKAACVFMYGLHVCMHVCVRERENTGACMPWHCVEVRRHFWVRFFPSTLDFGDWTQIIRIVQLSLPTDLQTSQFEGQSLPLSGLIFHGFQVFVAWLLTANHSLHSTRQYFETASV